ncbi:hypothetical protein ABVT39_009206 [Epinephelus coioides]
MSDSTESTCSPLRQFESLGHTIPARQSTHLKHTQLAATTTTHAWIQFFFFAFLTSLPENVSSQANPSRKQSHYIVRYLTKPLSSRGKVLNVIVWASKVTGDTGVKLDVAVQQQAYWEQLSSLTSTFVFVLLYLPKPQISFLLLGSKQRRLHLAALRQANPTRTETTDRKILLSCLYQIQLLSDYYYRIKISVVAEENMVFVSWCDRTTWQ